MSKPPCMTSTRVLVTGLPLWFIIIMPNGDHEQRGSPPTSTHDLELSGLSRLRSRFW